MKKKISVITIICILALCLGACGKNSSSETQSTSADQASAQTPAETQSAAQGSVLDSALVGNWQESVFDSGFIFNSDGTGTDTFWDLTFTYETDAGQVLIIYDSDTYGASQYIYSITGDTLTMTRIDEEETSSFTYTKTTVSETTTAAADPDDSAEGEANGEGEADGEEAGN